MTRRHGLTPEQVHEMVVQTRAAQGLPPKITDPSTLKRIADLVTAVDRKQEQAA